MCIPAGHGPFPAALYNHGGLGDAVGGDLHGTCVALSEAGYLAYSKQRRLTETLVGHLDDVNEGLNALLESSDWNGEDLAVLGFSRGGLLTLQLAKSENNLIDAIVLMAPADGNGTMERELKDVSAVSAPVLLLVGKPLSKRSRPF